MRRCNLNTMLDQHQANDYSVIIKKGKEKKTRHKAAEVLGDWMKDNETGRGDGSNSRARMTFVSEPCCGSVLCHYWFITGDATLAGPTTPLSLSLRPVIVHLKRQTGQPSEPHCFFCFINQQMCLRVLRNVTVLTFCTQECNWPKLGWIEQRAKGGGCALDTKHCDTRPEHQVQPCQATTCSRFPLSFDLSSPEVFFL